MAKIEDAGELPGLMIEEMMESASLVQGGEEETEQGLLLEEKVTNIIYVATSSHDLYLLSTIHVCIPLYPERGEPGRGGGGEGPGAAQVEAGHAPEHGRAVRAAAGGLGRGAMRQVSGHVAGTRVTCHQSACVPGTTRRWSLV